MAVAAVIAFSVLSLVLACHASCDRGAECWRIASTCSRQEPPSQCFRAGESREEWCACNMWGSNCKTCYAGRLQQSAFLQASANASDHAAFEAMDLAERRAHLGRAYACKDGGDATEEFQDFVLAQMDRDQDGSVSRAEFDGADRPLDLGAWPQERRCSPLRASAPLAGAPPGGSP